MEKKRIYIAGCGGMLGEAFYQQFKYDYIIKCDDENNPPDVIDRNELRVQIGIKPVKTIEFIMIDFICARTGASWSEVL